MKLIRKPRRNLIIKKTESGLDEERGGEGKERIQIKVNIYSDAERSDEKYFET